VLTGLRRVCQLICLTLILVSVIVASGQSFAQSADPGESVAYQTRKISELTQTFANDQADLSALEKAFLTHRSEILATQDALREEERAVQETLNRLGPEVSGEAAGVTRERNQLMAELDGIRQGLTQTRQNLTQLDRLALEVETERRSAFYADLTGRGPLFLHPDTWAEGSRALTDNIGHLQSELSDHLSDDHTGQINLPTGLALIGAIVLSFVLAIPVRNRLNHYLIVPLGRAESGSALDVVIGLFRAGLRTLPVVLAAVLLAGTIAFLDVVPPSLSTVLNAFWTASICVAAVSSLCSVFFSVVTPLQPFNFSDRQRAFLLWFGFVSAAGLIALDHVVRVETNVFGMAEELDVLIRGSVAILLSGFIFVIARVWTGDTPVEASAGSEESEATPEVAKPLLLPKPFRALLTVFAGFCGLIALVGYSSLAHFLTTRLFLVGGLTLSAIIVRDACVQLLAAFADLFLSKSERQDDKKDLFQFWLNILSTCFVFALWVPFASLLIGFEWSSVQRGIMQAVNGVQIGSVRFSLAQVAIAVLVFLGLIGATRLVQRTTQSRVFSRLRVDPGVQNSLRTLIGYIGLVIAFFTGVSLLGFDLSNLAIIAGALSVGIGFGLQSIVNNFVSGLILLFERPIKIGDWVVTSSGEGIVKKISVRSTEIETFDRSSILVPNSELISNSVTNWTHKSRLGRVTVAVGVAYKEDPDQIIEILSKVPENFEQALKFPEPQVLFTSFGASSLDFELRFFIPDIMDALSTRTQTRIAVLKAFREAGIEIPFPQRDIHIQPADMNMLTKHVHTNED
tara:strand:- start:23384 stop:25777 length:2394 start_codon:yes stop_codon:yes gene_type:complete